MRILRKIKIAVVLASKLIVIGSQAYAMNSDDNERPIPDTPKQILSQPNTAENERWAKERARRNKQLQEKLSRARINAAVRRMKEQEGAIQKQEKIKLSDTEKNKQVLYNIIRGKGPYTNRRLARDAEKKNQ